MRFPQIAITKAITPTKTFASAPTHSPHVPTWSGKDRDGSDHKESIVTSPPPMTSVANPRNCSAIGSPDLSLHQTSRRERLARTPKRFIGHHHKLDGETRASKAKGRSTRSRFRRVP